MFKYLDNKSSREHRKAYRKQKSFDPTCRNGRSCPYCMENRTKYRIHRKIIDREARRELDCERFDEDFTDGRVRSFAVRQDLSHNKNS